VPAATSSQVVVGPSTSKPPTRLCDHAESALVAYSRLTGCSTAQQSRQGMMCACSEHLQWRACLPCKASACGEFAKVLLLSDRCLISVNYITDRVSY
jgi:hypothetical protein